MHKQHSISNMYQCQIHVYSKQTETHKLQTICNNTLRWLVATSKLSAKYVKDDTNKHDIISKDQFCWDECVITTGNIGVMTSKWRNVIKMYCKAPNTGGYVM